jgi:aminopeptidase N
VPGLNISRKEAAERSAIISTHSYEVSIDTCQGSEIFLSTSRVKFSGKAGADTFIDAVGRKVISATLNGSAVDTTNYDGETIYLKNLAAENELVIEIEAEYSKTGEGLQYSVDPVDNEVYLYSQGETAYIRKMYPCFDQPDQKATFQLTLVGPNHWEVISNSPLKEVKELEGKKKQWEFLPTPRISTYITALVAGPYYHVHDEYRGSKNVPLGIYCRKSLAQFLDPEEIFLVTKQGFEYFEKVFGLAYPFEKYDQIAVVDFNWGAMENSGCVTFLERLLVFQSKVTQQLYDQRANTILHEMAHMWFGNMVTMKWWDDLWLNESFAEWSAHLAASEATRFTHAWTAFNSARKNWAYRQDQLGSTHPIVTDMVDIETVNANFDGITYAKGASVLQQLVAHVGRENFIAALRNYFAKHAFKNTTLDDLLVELEKSSGRDLKPWVATWLQTAGVNTLRPELTITDNKYSAVNVLQEAPKIPAGSKELRPHRLAVGLYDIKGEKLVRRESVELDVAGVSTSVEGLIGEELADLLLINDKDMSYAKVRLDERSIGTLKTHIGKIDEDLTRSLLWAIIWDMLRDAELSATDFVEILLSGIEAETNISVVTTLGAQLHSAIEVYAHPKNREALQVKAAKRIYEILGRATAGGDFQLQFTRIFASLATKNQVAELKDLLSGQLTGLVLDLDMRWLITNSLVERGALGQSDLDAELAKDSSLAAQLSHALGLAALPTVEAKNIAWHKIVKEEMSSAFREKTLQGFMRASQRELLAQWISPYFDNLLEMWGKKSYDISSSYVELCYPALQISQSVVDKTNNWLANEGKDSAAGLKRLLGESRDAMVRALAAQNKDN